MERMVINVDGRVQRVGYRDIVAEIARKMGVKGTVRNLDDEVSVEIIAEGEKKQLEEFLEKIRISDPPIEVEKIETRKETATGEFAHFRIIRGEPTQELGERIDVAVTLLYSMNKKLGSIDKKQDKMLEKQDKMLEKQDQMLEKQDKMLEKQDKMLEGQDVMVNELKGFKQETFSRFDTMNEKYGRISDKLDRISISLERLVSILEKFEPKL